MNIYMLYECDSWHSKNSMELLGAFSTHEKMCEALRGIAEIAIKEGHLNADDADEIVQEFKDLGQTQGYATNYTYDVITLDNYETE